MTHTHTEVFPVSARKRGRPRRQPVLPTADDSAPTAVLTNKAPAAESNELRAPAAESNESRAPAVESPTFAAESNELPTPASASAPVPDETPIFYSRRASFDFLCHVQERAFSLAAKPDFTAILKAEELKAKMAGLFDKEEAPAEAFEPVEVIIRT